MTRSSRRRHWDVSRIREAVRGEGIDPRTWVTNARITEVFWDEAIGWVTVVKAYGSEIEGVELECRQASALAGADAGEYLPLTVGAEVLVALPAASTGDLEPTVVSGVTNEEDKAPTEINGLPINGDATSSTPLEVSPHDTEMKVSPFGRREQYAKPRVVQAASHVLKADLPTASVLLGSENAEASFLLGESMVDQLIGIVDQLIAVLKTGGNGGGPVAFAALPAFELAWSTPQTGLKDLLKKPGVVLSVKVKGE